MSMTLETFHFDTSPLNDVAPMKMELISVNLDTSHSSIAPCTPSEQSGIRDDLIHLSTAFLSCALDCGENTSGPADDFSGIEIRIATNMTWWMCEETNRRVIGLHCLVRVCVKIVSCVCASLRASALLTCVHSHCLEVMRYNISDIFRAPNCEVSKEIVIISAKVRWQPVDVTSDFAAGSCSWFNRIVYFLKVEWELVLFTLLRASVLSRCNGACGSIIFCLMLGTIEKYCCACVCLCENIADAYVTGGNSRLFGSTIIALLKVLPVRMTVHPSGELKLSMLARNTTVHIMRCKIG